MLPAPEDLIRNDFASFVRKAFCHDHDGKKLGKEKYINYLCFELERVAEGETRGLSSICRPDTSRPFLPPSTCRHGSWLRLHPHGS